MQITEIHCTYDPETKGGSAPDGRKVKGTIHWVCAEKGLPVTVRLYDRLFKVEDPEADKDIDFLEQLNPQSKVVLSQAQSPNQAWPACNRDKRYSSNDRVISVPIRWNRQPENRS